MQRLQGRGSGMVRSKGLAQFFLQTGPVVKYTVLVSEQVLNLTRQVGCPELPQFLVGDYTGKGRNRSIFSAIGQPFK
jgi:hypothetical protein